MEHICMINDLHTNATECLLASRCLGTSTWHACRLLRCASVGNYVMVGGGGRRLINKITFVIVVDRSSPSPHFLDIPKPEQAYPLVL